VGTQGYTVLLPADAPRHVQGSHGFDGKSQRAAAPDGFARVEEVLNDLDVLRAGDMSCQGNPTVVASKDFGGETFRAVWEVLSGRRNRSLQLVSLVIKTRTAK